MGKRWQQWEYELLLNSSEMSIQQIADKLGRSYQAVAGKRHELKRTGNSIPLTDGRTLNGAKVRSAWSNKHGERDREICRRYYFGEETLEQIGDSYGMTRERIRQIVSRDTVLRNLHQRILYSRMRRREWLREKPNKLTFCKLCGEEADGRVYCCNRHRDVYLNILRYHLSENHRQRQKISFANWCIRNPDKVNSEQLRYSMKIINGEETDEHGRWMIEKSAAFRWAVIAYQKRWPVFEQFHEQVQDQIKEYAEWLKTG